MKISIIGAGNVGGTTAMRLAQEGAGEIVLIDIAKGLAQGKAFDLEDAQEIIKINYSVTGTDDMQAAANSDIIVVTAGLPRKPGMTREDLINKNGQILKDICFAIKKIAPQSILIIVTNPLDLMTRFAIEVTAFAPRKVFGMGVSLDAARFANLISKELKVPASDINACVIGSHGEGMLPLSRFTTIKGLGLEEFIDEKQGEELVQRTINRGAEIVSLLGSGSAYFAPSAAITALVKAVAKDEKRTIGVSAYLDGEYGIRDVCLGVPVRLGKAGIEEIVELELNTREKEALLASAGRLKEQFKQIAHLV